MRGQASGPFALGEQVRMRGHASDPFSLGEQARMRGHLRSLRPGGAGEDEGAGLRSLLPGEKVRMRGCPPQGICGLRISQATRSPGHWITLPPSPALPLSGGGSRGRGRGSRAGARHGPRFRLKPGMTGTRRRIVGVRDAVPNLEARRFYTCPGFNFYDEISEPARLQAVPLFRIGVGAPLVGALVRWPALRAAWDWRLMKLPADMPPGPRGSYSEVRRFTRIP